MPRLENWSVVGDYDPYQAPEAQIKRLEGNIYDDELSRFPDGSAVTTSRIVELDFENGFAQTRNTRYILGEPSDEYIKWMELNNVLF